MPKLPSKYFYIIFFTLLIVGAGVYIYILNERGAFVPKEKTKSVPASLLSAPVINLISSCDQQDNLTLIVIKALKTDVSSQGRIEYDNSGKFDQPKKVNFPAGRETLSFKPVYTNGIVYVRVSNTADGKQSDWSAVSKIRIDPCT